MKPTFQSVLQKNVNVEMIVWNLFLQLQPFRFIVAV